MKQNDLALMTIVVGPGTELIWEKTRPYFEAYADKIGADLVKMTEIPVVQRPIYESAFSKKIVRYEEAPLYPSAHWLKLALNDWLHKKYARMIYMDADLIIRPDCPNLFEVVPREKIGLFNEGDFTPRAMALHDAKIKMGDLPGWDGFSYYNTGVMVVSRFHRHLFALPHDPVKPLKFPFGEQTYLNHRIISRKVPVHELPWQFNRMSIMNKWLGVTRLVSYIVHYAGMNNPEATAKLVEKDGERWKTDAPGYHYEPCIFIEVGGGLGDQVNAEPALRYLSDHLHPQAEIWVLSTWPELFGHLKNIKAFSKTPEIARDAIFEIKTHPTPQTAMRKYVSHLFTHCVDYASMAVLKRTLPNINKRVKLEVKEEDRQAVARCDADILLHPGRGWEINTFPIEWWNRVIFLLCRYYKIAIIGRNVSEEHGVLPVECPSNGLDLRDKLSLGQLLAMIEKTWCLVTNDSAPVHLAGAFDNNIVLIPTSKHPDHLLPWRNGCQDYKARAVVGRLLEEDYPMTVNMIEWTTRKPEIDVKNYLPDPDLVARAVMKFGVPGAVYSGRTRDYRPEESQLSPSL